MHSLDSRPTSSRGQALLGKDWGVTGELGTIQNVTTAGQTAGGGGGTTRNMQDDDEDDGEAGYPEPPPIPEVLREQPAKAGAVGANVGGRVETGGEEGRRLWRLAGMGMELASHVAGGALIGWLLDWLFSTKPTILIIGTVAGVLTGMTAFIRSALKATKASAAGTMGKTGRKGG